MSPREARNNERKTDTIRIPENADATGQAQVAGTDSCVRTGTGIFHSSHSTVHFGATQLNESLTIVGSGRNVREEVQELFLLNGTWCKWWYVRCSIHSGAASGKL